MASTRLYNTNLQILIRIYIILVIILKQFFEKIGYPLEIIERAKQKVLAILHSEALKDKTEGITDPPSKIPLVLPVYHSSIKMLKFWAVILVLVIF